MVLMLDTHQDSFKDKRKFANMMHMGKIDTVLVILGAVVLLSLKHNKGQLLSCTLSSLPASETWQSSTYEGTFIQQLIAMLLGYQSPFSANNGVNGKSVSGAISGACAQTKSEANPWWQAKLDDSYYVTTVQIIAPETCDTCPEDFQLKNILVEIGEVSLDYATEGWIEEWNAGKQNCSFFSTAADNLRVVVNCSKPLFGNFVRLTKLSIEEATLSLCEVNITGYQNCKINPSESSKLDPASSADSGYINSTVEVLYTAHVASSTSAAVRPSTSSVFFTSFRTSDFSLLQKFVSSKSSHLQYSTLSSYNFQLITSVSLLTAVSTSSISSSPVSEKMYSTFSSKQSHTNTLISKSTGIVTSTLQPSFSEIRSATSGTSLQSFIPSHTLTTDFSHSVEYLEILTKLTYNVEDTLGSSTKAISSTSKAQISASPSSALSTSSLLQELGSQLQTTSSKQLSSSISSTFSMPTLSSVSSTVSLSTVSSISSTVSVPTLCSLSSTVSIPKLSSISSTVSVPSLSSISSVISVSTLSSICSTTVAVPTLSATVSMPTLSSIFIPGSMPTQSSISSTVSMPKLSSMYAMSSVPTLSSVFSKFSKETFSSTNSMVFMATLSSISTTDSMSTQSSISSTVSMSAMSSISTTRSMPTLSSISSTVSTPKLSSIFTMGSMPTQSSISTTGPLPTLSSIFIPGSMPTQSSISSMVSMPKLSSMYAMSSVPTLSSVSSKFSKETLSSTNSMVFMATLSSISTTCSMSTKSSMSSTVSMPTMSSISTTSAMPTLSSISSTVSTPKLSSISTMGSMPTQSSISTTGPLPILSSIFSTVSMPVLSSISSTVSIPTLTSLSVRFPSSDIILSSRDLYPSFPVTTDLISSITFVPSPTTPSSAFEAEVTMSSTTSEPTIITPSSTAVPEVTISFKTSILSLTIYSTTTEQAVTTYSTTFLPLSTTLSISLKTLTSTPVLALWISSRFGMSPTSRYCSTMSVPEMTGILGEPTTSIGMQVSSSFQVQIHPSTTAVFSNKREMSSLITKMSLLSKSMMFNADVSSTPLISSSSVTSIVSQQSSVIPVWCPCTCEQAKLISSLTSNNKTTEQVTEEIEEALTELTVDSKTTTVNERKLVSADDKRGSAKLVGTVGVVFCATIIVLIILSDLPRMIVGMKHVLGR